MTDERQRRRWNPALLTTAAGASCASALAAAALMYALGRVPHGSVYLAIATAQAAIVVVVCAGCRYAALKPVAMALISVQAVVSMAGEGFDTVQITAIGASLTMWLLMYHERRYLRIIGAVHFAVAAALMYAFPAPATQTPYLDWLVFACMASALAAANVITDRANRAYWMRARRLEDELTSNAERLRETHAELASQRDALEASAAALRETAAANAPRTAALKLAHEEQTLIARAASDGLRQPLRNINSFVQLIRRRLERLSLVDEVRDYLDFVTDGARRMDGMIEDLLRYSDGRVETDPIAVDPAAVLAQIRDNLRDLLAREGASLAFADDFPAIVGHPTQVLQLFQNLLSNGVKFKRPGVAPRCEVACVVEDGVARFSVSDNGIGIPANRLADVFGLFTRLHERDAYEGTGIGLATCRRIVLAAGGEIWAESVEGEGTTFCFTWPLAPGLTPKPNAATASAEAGERESARVPA